MLNPYGYHCPVETCSSMHLRISALREVTVILDTDSEEIEDEGDVFWENECAVYCLDCHWEGRVEQLVRDEGQDEFDEEFEDG